MRTRFRAKKSYQAAKVLLIACIVALSVAIFEIYRVIVPFQSDNPLWHEITAGQSVIDGWLYQGLDEEGYLKFYNQGQTVLLPPTSKMLDLDGQFVVIEHYTSTSLTFAEPYDAIPLNWILWGLGVVFAVAGLVFWKARKRGLRMKLRKGHGVRLSDAFAQWRQTAQGAYKVRPQTRFRPNRPRKR